MRSRALLVKVCAVVFGLAVVQQVAGQGGRPVSRAELRAAFGGDPVPPRADDRLPPKTSDLPACEKLDTPCTGYACVANEFSSMLCERCIGQVYKSCAMSKYTDFIQNCTSTKATQDPPRCGRLFTGEAHPTAGCNFSTACATHTHSCGSERALSITSQGPDGANECKKGE